MRYLLELFYPKTKQRSVSKSGSDKIKDDYMNAGMDYLTSINVCLLLTVITVAHFCAEIKSQLQAQVICLKKCVCKSVSQNNLKYLYLITPASKVSENINRHANVRLQCERIHSA